MPRFWYLHCTNMKCLHPSFEHSTLRFICIAETQAVTFKIGRKDSQLTASPRAIYLHVKHTMALIGHAEAGGIQNQFPSQLQDRLLQEWQGWLELSMQPSQKSSLGLATRRPVCSIQWSRRIGKQKQAEQFFLTDGITATRNASDSRSPGWEEQFSEQPIVARPFQALATGWEATPACGASFPFRGFALLLGFTIKLDLSLHKLGSFSWSSMPTPSAS